MGQKRLRLNLVTTAAELTFAPVADLTTEQVKSMLVSKFWGPFYASQYAAPYIAKDGSITFFSGLAAYRPAPGASIVAALNAALEGFAMTLALEIKPIRSTSSRQVSSIPRRGTS